MLAYLVVARTHEGVVTKVAADVGRDDLTIDAIARDKVFVLSSTGSGGGVLVPGCSRHCDLRGYG